jgi:SAM-dependent methyltransferase
MSEQKNSPFNERLSAERRRRAFQKNATGNFLLTRAIEDMADRLLTVTREFSLPVTLFCAGPETINAVQYLYPTADIFQLETDGIFSKSDIQVSPVANFGLTPARFDLAVSLLSAHAVNDLTGFLIQSRLCLKPDGLFLGCLLGAGTLQELREVLLQTEVEFYGGASPRVAPFADVRDMGGLMQRASFALPVTDSETLTVRYATLFDLIKDLRAMGFGNSLNARSRRPLTKAFWAKAAEIYAAKFSDTDGRIRATFSIIWLSGWATSPSQPKALRPGSATVSLKDILET